MLNLWYSGFDFGEKLFIENFAYWALLIVSRFGIRQNQEEQILLFFAWFDVEVCPVLLTRREDLFLLVNAWWFRYYPTGSLYLSTSAVFYEHLAVHELSDWKWPYWNDYQDEERNDDYGFCFCYVP